MESSDSNICLTPPEASLDHALEVETVSDQVSLTSSCIHRWAYRLARADGPNLEIATAVVGGCREGIDRENELWLLAVAQDEDLVQRLTDEDIERNSEKRDERYSELALFHVIQARAGNCEIP